MCGSVDGCMPHAEQGRKIARGPYARAPPSPQGPQQLPAVSRPLRAYGQLQQQQCKVPVPNAGKPLAPPLTLVAGSQGQHRLRAYGWGAPHCAWHLALLARLFGPLGSLHTAAPHVVYRYVKPFTKRAPV